MDATQDILDKTAQALLAAGKGVVVMDAECALCSAAARRIAHMDRQDEIRICTSQSALGRRLLIERALDPDDPESWLYLTSDGARDSLDAAIALGRRLGGVGRLLVIFGILPKTVRDWLYRRVARSRYRMFGKGNLCATIDPELRRRLIAEDL